MMIIYASGGLWTTGSQINNHKAVADLASLYWKWEEVKFPFEAYELTKDGDLWAYEHIKGWGYGRCYPRKNRKEYREPLGRFRKVTL